MVSEGSEFRQKGWPFRCCAAQSTSEISRPQRFMYVAEITSQACLDFIFPAHARMTAGSVPGLHLVNRRYSRSGRDIDRRGPRQRQARYLCLIEYEGMVVQIRPGRGASFAALPGLRECTQYVSGRSARSLQSRWSN